MPLALDLIAALLFGALATVCALAYPRSAPARPAVAAARAVGEAVPPPHWLRRTLSSRLDRTVASGLLLTLALGAAIAGGVVLGVLAYLIRSLSATQGVDNSVAAWGFHHRTPVSTRGLHLITDLGTAQVVLALAVVVVAVDVLRTRGRWAAPFLLAVFVGKEALTLSVKDLAGRVRPAFDPAAAGLGPSFPSGHSATSAAFYAAAALVLGRRHATPRPRPPRRARRRDRRGRRREPRPPRLPLAVRRRRRPRARLGLVRRLRDHVRRAPPPPDRGDPGRRGGRRPRRAARTPRHLRPRGS